LKYGPNHTNAVESITTCAELNGVTYPPPPDLTEGVTQTEHLEFNLPGDATGLRLIYNGEPLTTGEIIVDLGQ
jgi:hypothetical protein